MKEENKLLLERAIHIALCVAFMIYLWIPISQMEFKFVEVYPGSDKEKLEGFPIFNPKLPTESVLSFENYFNENFGFRDKLIVMNNNLVIFTIGYSRQARVVLGHNGWLYYEEGLVDNWRRPPYAQEELADIKRNTVAIKDRLAASGIHYVTVIAPDKHNIYSKYLPNDFREIALNPRAAQRVEYLKKNSDVPVVHLKSQLQIAGSKYPTYYKTDTHWNSYGSFIGYQELMKELKIKFPNLEPLELDDFDIVVTPRKGGDMAKNLALVDKFDDEEITLILKDEVKARKLTPDKKLRKAIVYLDSFFDPGYSWSTLQFLNHHFDVVLQFPNRDAYDFEKIEKEKPDVVIYEVVERHL